MYPCAKMNGKLSVISRQYMGEQIVSKSRLPHNPAGSAKDLSQALPWDLVFRQTKMSLPQVKNVV